MQSGVSDRLYVLVEAATSQSAQEHRVYISHLYHKLWDSACAANNMGLDVVVVSASTTAGTPGGGGIISAGEVLMRPEVDTLISSEESRGDNVDERESRVMLCPSPPLYALTLPKPPPQTLPRP